MFLTRGVRQKAIDVWDTREPPVLVRGDWRHPAAPNEKKRYWLPTETISEFICRMSFMEVPEPGQMRKVRR